MINEKAVDLNEALPLSLIRQHTKTDDDISVTDEQLILYRKAAIEAAEAYTGQVFGSVKTISEPISTRVRVSKFRPRAPIKLKKPSYDGIITLTGGNINGPIQTIIPKKTRTFTVPVHSISLDGCCNPCGQIENNGLVATYRTGASCVDEIPSGIIIGCLKYIAWQIANPGDVLVTMNNTKTTNSSGINGTNNAIFASGAAEQWRLYQLKN